MSSINWGRVTLGGLLAGVVINIFEFFLNGVVLARDWQAAMVPLGKSPIVGSQIVVFFVWSFVLSGFLIGIFAVWLYAAIRPRYGAGAKTALCVGSLSEAWAIY